MAAGAVDVVCFALRSVLALASITHARYRVAMRLSRLADVAPAVSRIDSGVVAFTLLGLFEILATVPARLHGLSASLWLDEAWVANSIREPSVAAMLWYDGWVQSTPPGLLLILRAFTAVAGHTEAALHAIPAMASLLACVVLAFVVRGFFRLPAALAAVALLATNYWGIKYGVHVKQYGTDLLVSAILAWVIVRAYRVPPSRPGVLTAAACAALLPLISVPAVFWLPSLVLATALPPGASPWSRDRLATLLRNVRGWAPIVLGAATAIAVTLLVFSDSGLDRLQDRRDGDMLHLLAPLESLRGLATSYGELLVPGTSVAAELVGLGLVAALIAAAVLVTVRAIRRDDARSTGVVLIGVLPVAAAFATSLLQQYPLLSYPRLILWSLPCCAVLAAYLVDEVHDLSAARLGRRAARSLDVAVVTASVAAAVLVSILFMRLSRPAELNREAVTYLSEHVSPQGCVFVHGGVMEQFEYYTDVLDYSPGCVYVGHTEWPCCALDVDERASAPEMQSLAADLQNMVRRTAASEVWVYLPSGHPGHWSGSMPRRFNGVSHHLAAVGCTRVRRTGFGYVAVWQFSCG
jgi:hypothetical protein